MAQVSYGAITITDITDIENVQNWYLATDLSSGVTKSNPSAGHGTWTTNIENATLTSDFQYLWNYEKILGTGNVEISSTQPIIIGHFGTNGINGVDGNSIISIDEYYKITNSTTNPGSNNWQKNTLVVPTINQRYLWNYQVVNYSKTAPEGSYEDARIIGVYGDTGQRGTSILKITTAPTSDSGIIGEFTYYYRISTSIVKTQSGKSEVLIGDIVEYNSNHYRVGYVNDNSVYLSAATSIKGTDGQTYYTWIKYAPNDNPTDAQISDSPINMNYIGIYVGTATPAPSTANDYAPWMKYIGTDGSPGVSVVSERELYYLKTNNISPSQITWNSSTSQPSQTIYSTDRQNSWTSVVPTYVNVTGAIYYTCIETSLSDNTKAWSAPATNNALTNANQKALEAYNTSVARDTEVNALKAQAKYYWWDSQGAHIAAGLTSTDSDANITHSQPSTYGFNSLMSPSALKLRYQNIDFAQLATNRLTFFRPATNGSTYVQGKKAMDLTADALTFYKPLAYNSSNEPTAAATLSSTGLNIVEGSIDLISSNTDRVHLSTNDLTSAVSINGESKLNWRLFLGDKFGVTNAGYMSVGSGKIGGFTIDQTELYTNQKNSIESNIAGIYLGNEAFLFGDVYSTQEQSDGGALSPIQGRGLYVDNKGNIRIGDDTSFIQFVGEEERYDAVEAPEGNPNEKGYYELINGSYVLSSDTTVVAGKTYYLHIEASWRLEIQADELKTSIGKKNIEDLYSELIDSKTKIFKTTNYNKATNKNIPDSPYESTNLWIETLMDDDSNAFIETSDSLINFDKNYCTIVATLVEGISVGEDISSSNYYEIINNGNYVGYISTTDETLIEGKNYYILEIDLVSKPDEQSISSYYEPYKLIYENGAYSSKLLDSIISTITYTCEEDRTIEEEGSFEDWAPFATDDTTVNKLNYKLKEEIDNAYVYLDERFNSTNSYITQQINASKGTIENDIIQLRDWVTDNTTGVNNLLSFNQAYFLEGTETIDADIGPEAIFVIGNRRIIENEQESYMVDGFPRLRLSSTKVDFINEDNDIVAYFGSEGFVTKRGILTQGNLQIGKYAFVPRANGSLDFKMIN